MVWTRRVSIRVASSLFLLLAGLGTNLSEVSAQIVPDATLGNERSQVIPKQVQGIDRLSIEGGAQKGQNLFHSFSDFNVGNGVRVYFSNPLGVSNILSRVTGPNASQILGKLGVDGTANLFLINPNGITFGANSTLDIRGSFTASTAESFTFPGGETFSAVTLGAAPEVTIAVPVGLQMGARSKDIESLGMLAAGENLSIIAKNITLKGALTSGRDLTLNAAKSLEIIDENRNIFMATSTGNMLLQGDTDLKISSQNVLTGTLNSGLHMTFRSNNLIRNYKEVISGGDFRVEHINGELGDFYGVLSIRSNGNVSFGNYNKGYNLYSAYQSGISEITRTRGANILALGNIKIGSIVINSGGISLVSSNGHISSDILLSSYTDANDLLSYDSPVSIKAYGDITTSTIYTEPIRSFFGSGGNVKIESQHGKINTGSISATFGGSRPDNPRFGFSSSGTVQLTAKNDIYTGNISTGYGGAVYINSLEGNIDVGSISSYKTGSPPVSLTAGKDIKSGSISVESFNSDISRRVGVGISGRSFTLSHGSSIRTSSKKGSSSSVFIKTTESVNFSGGKFSGIFALNGNNSLSEYDRSQIFIETGNLNIRDGFVISVENISDKDFYTNIIGFGGEIKLNARNINILDSARITASTLGFSQGGNISVGNPDDLLSRVIVSGKNTGIFSSSSGSGKAGNIFLYASVLEISDGARLLTSSSNSGVAGNISIKAKEEVRLFGNGSGIFSSTESFSSGKGGSVSLSSDKVYLQGRAGITVGSQGVGEAGVLEINARALQLDNYSFLSAETASNAGGNISLDILGSVIMKRNSVISTTAGVLGTNNAIGKGGDININARFIIAPPYENSDIKANAFNGEGGRVNINAEKVFGMFVRSRSDLIRLLGSSDPKDLDPIRLGTSDITAISQNNPTLNGSVAVSQLAVDPTRGLNAEPLRPQKPNVAEDCGSQNQSKESRVTSSGKGGITPTPSDSLTGSMIWQDPNQPIASSPPPEERSLPIAQGWVQKSNGNILLVGTSFPTSPTPACHVR